MSFFKNIWNFLKSSIGEISKIFHTIYNGIKFVVECVRKFCPEIKNTWLGTIAEALGYIVDLLDFLESAGAKIDANSYKSKLKDLDLDKYGDHHFNLTINQA